MTDADLWKLLEDNLVRLRDISRYIVQDVFRYTKLAQLYCGNDLLDDGIIKLMRSDRMRNALAERPEDLPHIMRVIVRHLAYDILRDKHYCKTSSVEQTVFNSYTGEEKDSWQFPDKELLPDMQLELAEQKQNLRAAIEHLGIRYPETAIVLQYGLDVDEPNLPDGNCHERMAEDLGISSTSYRQYRHKGIRRLRTNYCNLLGLS